MSNSTYQEIEFPDPLWGFVIIAMKGLPHTCKSEIARLLGPWTKGQVLYIDHFLDALSIEKGYNAASPPPTEEAERLNRLAFDVLCKAAGQQVSYRPCRVVIKSRLCSMNELDRLLELATKNSCRNLIIIECRMKNEYRWKSRLGYKLGRWRHQEWYKPRSSIDLEVARDDYVELVDEASFDLHIRLSIKGKNEWNNGPCVTRLVLDPFDDLELKPTNNLEYLIPAFRGVMRHILKHHEEAGKYEVVQFDELRKFLLEKKLHDAISRKRSKYLCTKTSTEFGCCVFRFLEDLTNEGVDEKDSLCGVCEERVVSGQPVYTCYFCVLTLHKSCSEKFKPMILKCLQYRSSHHCLDYQRELSVVSKKYACSSCVEAGKDFSPKCESCLYQTHLKCKLLPTIINHDCHHHFLSLKLKPRSLTICKICGDESLFEGYSCNICKLFFHMRCIFRPKELKNKHGGYEHVMKLTYSRDGMEEEEDCWCDFCYRIMDPQTWFYNCQECLYYVAHLRCVGDDPVGLEWDPMVIHSCSRYNPKGFFRPEINPRVFIKDFLM